MYKKYVVGLCGFEEDIQLVTVQSKSMLNAMCVAVRDNYGWDVLKENNDRLPFVTVDEAIDYFLQGDINISKPLEI